MSRNKQKPGKPKKNGFAPSVQMLVSSPGPGFDALGKKWRLGFNDQNAKGALEELIREHVIRRELPVKKRLGPELGDMYWRSEVAPLLAEGYYSTFGPGWLATLKSPDGVILFVQSLLMKNHPDASAELVQEMLGDAPEQMMAAVEVVAPDFFAAVAVQMGYSTEDARKAAPQIAAAIKDNIAAYKREIEPTPPEPVTSPT